MMSVVSLTFIHFYGPYPKKTVGVLREDCMSPVICVGVWYSVDPRPQ